MRFTKFIPALALALIVIVLPLSASANHASDTFSISPLQVPPNSTTAITITVNNNIGQTVNSFVINMADTDAVSGTISSCTGNWHTTDYGDGYTGYVVNQTIPNASTYSVTCQYNSTTASNAIVLDFYEGSEETGFIHSTGSYPQTITADGTPSGGGGGGYEQPDDLTVLNASNSSSFMGVVWGFIMDNIVGVLILLAFIMGIAIVTRLINRAKSGHLGKI